MSINIQNEIRGIAMMASSSVLFALVAGLLRYASEVDVFTAALFRFAVGIALLGTAAMANRITLTFVRSRLLFIRGFLGGRCCSVLSVHSENWSSQSGCYRQYLSDFCGNDQCVVST